MFKVLCIKDNWHPSPGMKGKPHPYFSEICEVSNTIEFLGHTLYRIDKYDGWFKSTAFALISDIDESEHLAQEDKMLMAIVESMPDEKLDPVANERIMNNLSRIFGW